MTNTEILIGAMVIDAIAIVLAVLFIRHHMKNFKNNL